LVDNAKKVVIVPQSGTKTRAATRGRWVDALIWGEQPAKNLATYSSLGGHPLRSFPGKPGLPSSGLLEPGLEFLPVRSLLCYSRATFVLSQKLLKL
jgi:hypothetical protein